VVKFSHVSDGGGGEGGGEGGGGEWGGGARGEEARGPSGSCSSGVCSLRHGVLHIRRVSKAGEPRRSPFLTTRPVCSFRIGRLDLSGRVSRHGSGSCWFKARRRTPVSALRNTRPGGLCAGKRITLLKSISSCCSLGGRSFTSSNL